MRVIRAACVVWAMALLFGCSERPAGKQAAPQPASGAMGVVADPQLLQLAEPRKLGVNSLPRPVPEQNIPRTPETAQVPAQDEPAPAADKVPAARP
jgi:hypothetical protein